MSWRKRVRNLWKWSQFDPDTFFAGVQSRPDSIIRPLSQEAPKIEKAQIIKRGEPIEAFLDNVNQKQ